MSFEDKSKAELLREIEAHERKLAELRRMAFARDKNAGRPQSFNRQMDSIIHYDDAPLQWINRLKPGHHLCCIYETEEEHRNVVTSFIISGLENGEKVFYIVDAHTADEIRNYLCDEGADASEYEKSGQLIILTRDDSYMKNGVFDPDAMIELLRDETDRALDEGYSALRVTGEMTWALRNLPGSERLIEYEAKLNNFIPGSGCLAICQYDRNRFDPNILLDVRRTHPIAVIGTQAFENLFYVPPDAMLGPQRQEVELNRWIEGIRKRHEIESFLHAVLDHLPIGVAVNTVAPDVEFVYVNDNFLKFYRVTMDQLESPDSFWEAVYHDPAFREEIKKRVREDCASGDSQRMRWESLPIMRKGEETTYISAMNIPVPDRDLMMSTVWDVTERKTLEEQYLHSQKMEAVGRLAGGVAHDFNNILTGISGYTQFSLGMLPKESDVRQDLEEIEHLSRRAADLTRQLLAFGRKQTLNTAVFDINSMVDNMSKMFSRILGEDIIFDIHFKADDDYVRADQGQIEQVLMNLVLNARDAMPGGGKLTIESYNTDIVDDDPDPEVKPGYYVVLAVSDTGEGIDAEVKKHIFEPFFTTKATGKGTGLGLPMAYGIVKQHSGKLWVYSEPGKGTTLKAYLPVVDKPADVSAEAEEKTESDGAEMILIVEDESAVRVIIERSLAAHGYAALSAGSGAEAEKVFAEHPGEISLLLTDVIMPDINGRELYKKLVERQPDLKVLYMSGYTDNSIVHHGVLDQGVDFIQKPFTPDQIALKVRETLNK